MTKLVTLFFCLVVVPSSCNNPPAREDFVDFESRYANRIIAVTDWLESLHIDSSFSLEFRYRSGDIMFHYYDGNKSGSYFNGPSEIPNGFKNLFSDIVVSEITWEQGTHYYLWQISYFGKRMILLTLADQETQTCIQIWNNGLREKLGFTTTSKTNNLYVADGRIAFIFWY